MRLCDLRHVLCNLGKRRGTVNRPQCIRIYCLHSDLQLQKSRTQRFQHFDLLLIDQICRYLTVKIRHAIIMIPQKTPQFQRARMTAVKGTVYKFYLLYIPREKIQQLLFHQLHAPVSDALIDRGEAVAAGKRTAAARLVVEDTIFKFLQILIDKWKVVEIPGGNQRYCALKR